MTDAIVHFVFRTRLRSEKQTVTLPWVAGRPLRLYLQDPIFTPFGIVGIAIRSRTLNQDRKKKTMTGPLEAGESIFFVNPDTSQV